MGLGTSFMIRINVEQLLQQRNIKADINHMDLTTAHSTESDLYITTYLHALTPPNPKAHVIAIEDILDIEELSVKLDQFLAGFAHE